MAAPKTKDAETAKRSKASARRPARVTLNASSPAFAYATVLEEVRAAGLFDGHTSEHVSFSAPSALIEVAKRGAGVTSTPVLCLLGLALLAQPDPVVSAMRQTRGRLGSHHQLEY
jgi:hypothetical protein